METIADKLRRWRKAAGLTQEDAARVFLVTTSTYSKWEQGTREPTALSLRNIEAKVSA